MKPTDILINEHRIIEQVLNCLERMVETCTAQAGFEREPARDLLSMSFKRARCCAGSSVPGESFPER